MKIVVVLKLRQENACYFDRDFGSPQGYFDLNYQIRIQ